MLRLGAGILRLTEPPPADLAAAWRKGLCHSGVVVAAIGSGAAAHQLSPPLTALCDEARAGAVAVSEKVRKYIKEPAFLDALQPSVRRWAGPHSPLVCRLLGHSG